MKIALSYRDHNLLSRRLRLLAYNPMRRLLWYMKLLVPVINTQTTRVMWLPYGQTWAHVAHLPDARIEMGHHDGHYRLVPYREETIPLNCYVWDKHSSPFFFVAVAGYDCDTDTMFVSDWRIEERQPRW